MASELIIGCGSQAYKIYHELEDRRRSLGYQFSGYISVNGDDENMFYGINVENGY